MNKLSDRLQLIADNIDNGETMADIGTDHGFLPMYLLEKRISPFVIMADVSAGSLDKARDNFSFEKERLAAAPEGAVYADEHKCSFRLGSGLSVLKPAEVDAVVFAGMGGRLMIELLQEDFAKTCSYTKFILQPRNGQGQLRHWLKEAGLSVEKELLVMETPHICNILVVSTMGHSKAPTFFADAKWFRGYEPTPAEELPEAIIRDNGKLGRQLFSERLAHYREVLSGINGPRKDTITAKIVHIEDLLNKYK